MCNRLRRRTVCKLLNFGVHRKVAVRLNGARTQQVPINLFRKRPGMLIKCAANHKQSEQAVGSTARSDKRDSPGENSRTPRLGARAFRIRTRGLFTCAYRTNPATKTTPKTEEATNNQEKANAIRIKLHPRIPARTAAKLKSGQVTS